MGRETSAPNPGTPLGVGVHYKRSPTFVFLRLVFVRSRCIRIASGPNEILSDLFRYLNRALGVEARSSRG